MSTIIRGVDTILVRRRSVRSMAFAKWTICIGGRVWGEIIWNFCNKEPELTCKTSLTITELEGLITFMRGLRFTEVFSRNFKSKKYISLAKCMGYTFVK